MLLEFLFQKHWKKIIKDAFDEPSSDGYLILCKFSLPLKIGIQIDVKTNNIFILRMEKSHMTALVIDTGMIQHSPFSLEPLTRYFL